MASLQLSIAFSKHQVTEYSVTHACPVGTHEDASVAKDSFHRGRSWSVLRNIQDRSFETKTASIKTKTKTSGLKTKTKTGKNRSRVLSRPRPRSRGLHLCLTLGRHYCLVLKPLFLAVNTPFVQAILPISLTSPLDSSDGR